MTPAVVLLLFLILKYPILLVSAQDTPPQDLYCGDQICYDVLGITRDSPKSDISKSYRKLAKKWHPDRFRRQEEKEAGQKKFLQIAAAYEVLKDDESREEYNYMLDNPEEMWQNYYRYYRRRMVPKVDVRLVLIFTLTIVSAIQYYCAWSNYGEAIKYLVTVPKYRMKATEIAKSDGMLKRDKKLDKGKTKDQIKEEEENVIRSIVQEKMDIQGCYAKPNVWDVLLVQLVILPYTTFLWVQFYSRWIWKFGICRQEYGPEERIYVIRRNMKLSEGQFNALTEDEREDFLDQELWIREKFDEWKKSKEEEMRIKMAQSGRYKQYRRYMKNHGTDRMTFDDS